MGMRQRGHGRRIAHMGDLAKAMGDCFNSSLAGEDKEGVILRLGQASDQLEVVMVLKRQGWLKEAVEFGFFKLLGKRRWQAVFNSAN